MNYDTWLSGIQSTEALRHPSERSLRLASDVRLLAAIRTCHREHMNHIRRLDDIRALALHTLHMPLVRVISLAQGVHLQVELDSGLESPPLSLHHDVSAAALDDDSSSEDEAVSPLSPMQSDGDAGGDAQEAPFSVTEVIELD